MKKLAQAILNVMKAVKGIEKNTTVGSGYASYKGVSDKDVKQTYSKAMQDNGLVILPISVEDHTEVNRWTAKDGKSKQSVFCSVKTKYLLLHESGESQEIAGYGHGVDSQDKAAGKATTYAMKYALLYTFMTPTGDIDDSDTTHSNDIETPPVDNRQRIKDDKIQEVINKAKEQGLTIANIEEKLYLEPSQKATIVKALKTA